MTSVSPRDPLRIVFEAARLARTDARIVLELVERRLIDPPGAGWPDAVLDDILRARRLQDLGVSLAGVEVIFHMRALILHSRDRTQRLEAELARLRRERDAEIARWMLQVSAPGYPGDTEEATDV